MWAESEWAASRIRSLPRWLCCLLQHQLRPQFLPPGRQLAHILPADMTSCHTSGGSSTPSVTTCTPTRFTISNCRASNRSSTSKRRPPVQLDAASWHEVGKGTSAFLNSFEGWRRRKWHQSNWWTNGPVGLLLSIQIKIKELVVNLLKNRRKSDLRRRVTCTTNKLLELNVPLGSNKKY